MVAVLAVEHRPAPGPLAGHRFVVIAHRGQHDRAPENTLEAIEAAIQTGADYVELDVRSCRDGALVLMHDATVDRTTEGHGAVRALSLAEIQRLRVRAPESSEWSACRVPTFDEALRVMRGRIRLYLDFKGGERKRVVVALRREGMLEETVVYDGPSAFPAWRKLAPNLPLMCSLPGLVDTAAKLKAFVRQRRPDVFDGGLDRWDAGLAWAAQETGVPVWPDVQGAGESPARWQAAWELGVRGVQTDQPAELIRWLEAAGRR